MHGSKRMVTVLGLLVVGVSVPGMAEALPSMPLAGAAGLPLQGGSIAGKWTGKLDVGGGLTLVVHITAAANGALTSTLDSPDQGANGIPVAETTFTDGVLHLNVTAVQGEFEGRLSADGTKITGEWRQGGLNLPLELGRGEPPPRKPKPQEPVPPLPYDTAAVTFPNASAGITLAGTLTLPRTPGRHPAAVLITGSGAQDRDEALLGHKPFLVLADHLTRKGIAVLRVDDRGVGGSGGNFATSTTADFVTDVLAAVAYMKTRPEVDPAKIGLIGHSEGGLIAPAVAARSPDVAFVIMMAGPGVTGEEILNAQIAKIARAAGTSEDDIQRSLRNQNRIYAILRAHPDSATANPELRTMIRAAIDSLSEKERATIGSDEQSINAYIETQVKQVTSPWFRYFLTYDPRPALEKVKVPLLAINGSLDLQVPPEQNLPQIEAALKRGGNKDFTVRELPGLNHLFQPAKTGSPTEYADIDVTIAPAALDLMSSWILARFGR